MVRRPSITASVARAFGPRDSSASTGRSPAATRLSQRGVRSSFHQRRPPAERSRSRAGERVGGGAEPEVRRVVPVLAVVARLVVAAAREVGDLVRGVARVREEAVRDLEESGLLALGHLGQLAALRGDAEARARVDRELIAGDVARLERDGRRQLAPPRLRRLAGQAEDEVDGDGVEACGLRGLDRGPRLLRAVAAAEEAERVVGEGLHAEGEGAHPEAPPGGAGVGRHVLGVGLEEDPGVGRERQVRAAGGDDAREVLRRQLRRGARRRSTRCRRAAGLPTRARREATSATRCSTKRLRAGTPAFSTEKSQYGQIAEQNGTWR